MERYYNTVQNSGGNVINGATVTVYNANTGAVATLYQANGVTALANPFLSGYARSEGEIEFSAANGQYNIKIVSGPETDWIYGITLNDIQTTTIMCGTPVGIAPSGTMGNNGAVTLGTGLTFISGAMWLYFPANAISAGSAAGIYWTVMSTGTAGTVYNNTFDGTAGIPSTPTTLVPFVTTGPGAYTGIITEVTVATVSCPANSLGANGNILGMFNFSHNNSANVKIMRSKLGGQEFLSFTASTTWHTVLSRPVSNAGVTNKQYGMYPSAATTGAINANPFLGTVDTTVDQNIIITLQNTVATESLFLRSMKIDQTYGA